MLAVYHHQCGKREVTIGGPLHDCPDCLAKRQEVRRALRMHFSAKALTS